MDPLVHACCFVTIDTLCMEHAHFMNVLVELNTKPTLVKHLGWSAYILVLQTGYTNW